MTITRTVGSTTTYHGASTVSPNQFTWQEVNIGHSIVNKSKKIFITSLPSHLFYFFHRRTIREIPRTMRSTSGTNKRTIIGFTTPIRSSGWKLKSNIVLLLSFVFNYIVAYTGGFVNNRRDKTGDRRSPVSFITFFWKFVAWKTHTDCRGSCRCRAFWSCRHDGRKNARNFRRR